MVLYNPGDEVITHAPYWPTIPEQIKLADATPVIVHTKAEDGFAIHPDAIIAAITPRTKAIIINSPAIPTGAVISEENMAAIADAAAKRGIWVIVDLCYEKLIYDNVPHNLVKVLTDRMRDRAVLCGSASKAYSMTGWRCGWILAPGGSRDGGGHASGALDVERRLDLSKGGASGADGLAGSCRGDAERIQDAPRQADGVVRATIRGSNA